MLMIFKKWYVITCALKSEGLEEIWDTWSQKGTSYNKEESYWRVWKMIIPIVDISKLVNLLHVEKLTILYD